MIAFNGSVLSLTQIIVWLVIALICGAVAQALLGYSHIGLLSATALGLLGALVGTWLASALRLPSMPRVCTIKRSREAAGGSSMTISSPYRTACVANLFA